MSPRPSGIMDDPRMLLSACNDTTHTNTRTFQLHKIYLFSAMTPNLQPYTMRKQGTKYTYIHSRSSLWFGWRLRRPCKSSIWFRLSCWLCINWISKVFWDAVLLLLSFVRNQGLWRYDGSGLLSAGYDTFKHLKILILIYLFVKKNFSLRRK